FSTEVQGGLAVVGSICIGADPQRPELISPVEERVQIAADLRLDHGHLTHNHFSSRTVQGDPVTFVKHGITKGEGLFRFIDLGSGASGYAALTHAAGNYCSVGSHTAAGGENAFRHVHAANI